MKYFSFSFFFSLFVRKSFSTFSAHVAKLNVKKNILFKLNFTLFNLRNPSSYSGALYFLVVETLFSLLSYLSMLISFWPNIAYLMYLLNWPFQIFSQDNLFEKLFDNIATRLLNDVKVFSLCCELGLFVPYYLLDYGNKYAIYAGTFLFFSI